MANYSLFDSEYPRSLGSIGYTLPMTKKSESGEKVVDSYSSHNSKDKSATLAEAKF